MSQFYSPQSPPHFQIGYRDRIIQENEPDCMHYHDGYEMILVERSRCTCFVGDRNYRFDDRSLLLIPPQRMHTIHYRGGTEYVLYVMNFSEIFIRAVLAAVGAPELLDRLNEAPCHAVQLAPGRFQQLRGLFQSLYTADQSADNLLRGYLGVLLLEAEKDFRHSAPDRALQGRQEELVEAAIRYVDANYRQKITLEGISGMLYVSKFHFSHIFTQATGSGFIRYVQCRRVLEAQKLLMQGKLSNQQIAALCGFESPQHFYRVFKKITGKVPGNYRMPSL